MNHKFFLNCIGIAAIVFASAFLIRSIQPANAAPPRPENFVAEGGNQIGKYQMQFSEGVDGNGNFYFHALIWDSETGKSSVYSWNRSNQSWEEFFTGKDQIPSDIK